MCPFCATPLARGHHRRSRRVVADARLWIDRTVLLLAGAACFYLLVYRHAIAPPPPAPAPGEDPQLTPVQAAKAALEAGDLETAAADLEAAVKDPDHDPALDLPYVIAARRAGKPINAKAALKRARAAAPNDPQVLLLAAEVALDEGDLEDALRSFEKVPDSAKGDDYRRARVRLLDAKKDEAGALAELERLKARTPAEGRRLSAATLVKGTIELEDSRLEAARTTFERAIVLAPDYAPARVRLGTVLLRLDKLGLAKQSFEKARELAPLEAAPALGHAIALDRLGEKEAAVRAYRDFLDRASRDERFAEEAKAVARRLQALTGQ